MFGLKRKTVAEPKEPVAVPVTTPVAAPPEIPTGARANRVGISAEYVKLCQKLGLNQPVVGYILEENGICVYEYDKVVAYLDHKYGFSFDVPKWVWRPLRPKDEVRGFNFNDMDASGCYKKPVPFEVLSIIAKLEDALPGAKFFISDERRPGEVKDPFLLLMFDSRREFYVIERWDEPSFRL